MKLRDNTALWRGIIRATALCAFHAVENNGDAAFEHDGEVCLLSEIAVRWRWEAREPIVFDVGAHIGEYSERVLAEVGRLGLGVLVHAVEPSTTCVQHLVQRFAAEPRVRVHQAAVSDASGTLRLRADRPGSTLASLVPRPDFGDAAGEDVSVVRLDALIGATGVERIDLLELDVEGAELAALKGLGVWLDPKRVNLIKFEYGGTTLDARASLREIAMLLKSQGYRSAKLFPRSLEFRRYAAWMEHFNYANFLAVGTDLRSE